MNADDVNSSVPESATSTVRALNSNPPLAPPKSNKRKNHRAGRRTKKQNPSTAQDPLTVAKDVAVINTVEDTVPKLTKKHKQMRRKKCRKPAKAPHEITIPTPDAITERQADVAIRILKQDCVSVAARDDPTRPSHHRADSSTQELAPSRSVNEDISARAETSKAISAVEQQSVSGGEGASGDIAIHGGHGLEAGFKSVATGTETSQSKYYAILSISANLYA